MTLIEWASVERCGHQVAGITTWIVIRQSGSRCRPCGKGSVVSNKKRGTAIAPLCRMSAGQPIDHAVIGAAFVVLFNASSAFASCGTDGQGPCYRFWKVDAVFVAKVLDKVPLRAATDPEPSPGTVVIVENYRLQVRVAVAFRGVKAGDVMTLFAPDGVCGGVNAEDGGELFIYASRNKNGELWAQGCGVSKPLEEADADLAYARSVSVIGPSPLIYGDVFQHEDRTGGPEDFSAMGGVQVRVHSRDFEAETFTDRDGNYSITLPGSGSYTIEVIPPRGFADRLGNGAVRFEIGDRRSCFNVPFQLRRNGRIRGRVIDREGRLPASQEPSVRARRSVSSRSSRSEQEPDT